MEIDKKRIATTITDPHKTYELSALIFADSFFYGLLEEDNLVLSDEIHLSELTNDRILSGFPVKINSGRIAILNNYFTIVPAKEYEPALAKEFVLQAVGPVVFSEAIYRADYQANVDAYICYCIPAGIFRLCHHLSKEHHICHAISAFTGSIRSVPGRQLIHICRLGRQTIFVASENDRLKLATTLVSHRPLSLLYYVTLMKQQLNFEDKKFDLELSGEFIGSDGVMNLLEKYFPRVSYRSALLSLDGSDISLSSLFYPLRSVSLCA